MSNRRSWGGSSPRLAALFLAVVLPPAATLVWLGLQLVEQDRSLWAQRELEGRQAAAQAIVSSLNQSLADAERHLSQGEPPPGAVRFVVSPQGVEAHPATRVLWLPTLPAMPAAEAAQFTQAETVEFQGGAERALAFYEEMARSSSPAIRAGALVRVARVHRRERRWREALTAYRRLAEIGEIAIDGMQVDLLARRAVCAVLEESGREEELNGEAAALAADLLAGRWTLDQPAWELVVGQLERWTGHPLVVPAAERTFSAAGSWLWKDWQRSPGGRSLEVSRKLIVVDETPLILVRRQVDSEMVALVFLPSVIEAWIRKAVHATSIVREQLSFVSDSGEVLVGPEPPFAAAAVTRAASDTGLPWTLVLSPGESARQTQELAGRRRLLFSGLAAIVLLLAGGSYLLWRVVQRELAVARLQTDFVSAVSHEFRTPLTSLRHVTDLLEEDDELPGGQRSAFYQVLSRNTERLQRLVENLLDFARMQGGRKPYDLQPVDTGALTAQVVEDFRAEGGHPASAIDLDVQDAGRLTVRADVESLTHAVWNLLDNAVKYSPQGPAIRVSVRRHSAGVAIAVQDTGIGIPRHERREIFRSFVRGDQVPKRGIKGTGLGLALVSHIVKAHGGTIELESEEGVGSTFRLVLPAHV